MSSKLAIAPLKPLSATIAEMHEKNAAFVAAHQEIRRWYLSLPSLAGLKTPEEFIAQFKAAHSGKELEIQGVAEILAQAISVPSSKKAAGAKKKALVTKSPKPAKPAKVAAKPSKTSKVKAPKAPKTPKAAAPGGKQRKERVVATEAHVAQVKDLLKEGLTVAAIVAKVGLSTSSVNKIKAGLGMTKPKK
jgi:hypothetical protein